MSFSKQKCVEGLLYLLYGHIHHKQKIYLLNIEKLDLNDAATRLISDSFKKCSSKYHCLDILVPKDALNVARKCLEELKNFSAKEKKNFMIAKVVYMKAIETNLLTSFA